MSDRIAVMSRGRVEQIGTPEEIYSTPASVFVAGFIGSANLLPGTLDGAAAGAPVAVLDDGERLTLTSTAGAVDGDPITVMLRPERIVVSTGPVDDGNSMGAVVKHVIFQGDTVRLITDCDAGPEMLVMLEADGTAPTLNPGDDVTLTWAPGAAFALRGRSAVVGSTTTDIDEVQASLDGTDAAVNPGDPAADRHEPSQFGRRALLIGGGLAGAAVVVGGVLAFTGGGESEAPAAGDGDGGIGGGAGAGSGTLGAGDSEVRVLNWQAYIDPTEDGTAGTIDRFQEESGIAVEYTEDFNDNNEVFNRLLAPVIGAGQTTGYDIICPTNWMAARLRGLDWVEPLPLDRIPNRVNLADRFLNQPWDFGALYNLPWQAGITGIAYNPEATGRELRSILDLFDPEFRGRVAMLTEMRDSVGLTMLGLGHDPRAVDEDAAMEAIEYIGQATNDGQFRAFTGNEYLQSLQNGDFVACVAWSGDVVQLQYERPDIQFVIPEEGGISWYDTMVIPKGAENGYAAADWMNFVYDPVQAAQLTYWVQYISPVKGVRDELVNMGGDAAALAESPILFPSEADEARLAVFAALPEDIDLRLTDSFLRVIGG